MRSHRLSHVYRGLVRRTRRADVRSVAAQSKNCQKSRNAKYTPRICHRILSDDSLSDTVNFSPMESLWDSVAPTSLETGKTVGKPINKPLKIADFIQNPQPNRKKTIQKGQNIEK